MYSILSRATGKIRIPFLVKLKILIGLGLLCNKELNAQKIDFPNNPEKSDTLTLDVTMEEDEVTMCYEVVVVNYHKKEPKFKGGQRAINQFVKDNMIWGIGNKFSFYILILQIFHL